MPTLKSISYFLSTTLKVNIISDIAYNGIQVAASDNIKKIAFAVDACEATFKEAIKQNCDLLIVHHGLFWGSGTTSLQGIDAKRIQFLFKNNLSLYAVHLPLDIHPTLGNNAHLAKICNLKKSLPFAEFAGTKCGSYGKCNSDLNLLVKKLNSTLKTKSIVLQFGKKQIRNLGIVAGAGADAISECHQYNIDTLLTGEFKHSKYHPAKELGINIIASGHYATETGGVKSLMPLLKRKFKVTTLFLDLPTGF
ncbi:Nif3-like dinuclear metal center hexameric protein [Candidatus Woesearchaeota archaeon CG10_big_fil_rev_8_21_14_0_10_34_8]|nr:MAG: Nif3-like dinuclear metal center hexameric protein [Candidatus Woesearchaeota archaeon CG10_big_fil_rev_8_21_14_0_10_34_8]